MTYEAYGLYVHCRYRIVNTFPEWSAGIPLSTHRVSEGAVDNRLIVGMARICPVLNFSNPKKSLEVFKKLTSSWSKADALKEVCTRLQEAYSREPSLATVQVTISPELYTAYRYQLKTVNQNTNPAFPVCSGYAESKESFKMQDYTDINSMNTSNTVNLINKPSHPHRSLIVEIAERIATVDMFIADHGQTTSKQVDGVSFPVKDLIKMALKERASLVVELNTAMEESLSTAKEAANQK